MDQLPRTEMHTSQNWSVRGYINADSKEGNVDKIQNSLFSRNTEMLQNQQCLQDVLIMEHNVDFFLEKYGSGPVRISYNANRSFHSVRKNKRGVSKNSHSLLRFRQVRNYDRGQKEEDGNRKKNLGQHKKYAEVRISFIALLQLCYSSFIALPIN